ncbi:MAG: response regulator transcription factor [Negativicutes bacterium]|nr:response regulator transcription factor [Negativicutes bacterium]
MKVLLVEDDKRLGRLIHHLLSEQELQVDWVDSGDVAADFAGNHEYDIVVLDWMLPKKSGLQVCRDLREGHFQGGILMLTAKDTVDDLVTGLEAGADDYLVKPFEIEELLARIRSVGRRSKIAFKEEVVKVNDLELNRMTRSALRGGRVIQLTGKEFQLLDLLVQNQGQVLPKEVILDQIWGLESEVSANNLEALVRLLRMKVDHAGEVELIHNIRGVGYKMGDRNASKDS